MALQTNPFHPSTGELLPGYRDAYLRGDLSVTSTGLVDAYLKANPTKGTEAFQRFHTLQAKGHAVQPVGWLQQQFTLIRTEPARFRQRAGALVLVGALLSGAVFAANNSTITPKAGLVIAAPATVASELPAAEAALVATAARTATIKGRIVNEKGQPLVGATVLDRNSGRGVSTDADGKYALAIPANQALKLQFGYGGYSEEEVQVKGHSVQNVTLLPRPDQKKHHWWQF